MRARLKKSVPGFCFAFLCNPDQEKRLLRVIAYAGGRVTARREVPAGLRITVTKTRVPGALRSSSP
ncbi:MAG: hypothetical protein L3J03_06285 [Desulfobacterales bacterium]|nr:hypothetical protein [Desulfobacterales bacterium]